MAKCPKCGSTNIHTDKQGYSVGKGLAGSVLFGGIGLIAGAIGSNKIRLTCRDCGCQFKPGEGAKNISVDYTPANAFSMPTEIKNKQKSTSWQKVKIETLLKYRSVISDSKVKYLEDLLEEGNFFVHVPGGEIEMLCKLQNSNSHTKRIVSFKVIEE
nr:MAG TPA: RNA polymerase-like protein [Caudoviricetes sp.]